MMRSLAILRLYSCANDKHFLRSVSRRYMSMEKRQNSVYPSSIYPRLESVDLQDDDVVPGDVPTDVKELDFENHVDAFRSKTTWEIVRALTVLRMCSVNTLVDNSLGMMKWVNRVCGQRVLRSLLKPTFYSQFVGGETTEEMRACVRRLAEIGTRAMLTSPMEEDVGEGGDNNVYDDNCQRILDIIDITTSEDTPSPMIQLKLSGLLPADLIVVLGNLYNNSSDKVGLIKAISKGLTGQKIDITRLKDVLDESKQSYLEKAVERLKKICTEAKKSEVVVLVDAEYTYLNPGLSLLTLAAVDAFNKDSAIVWNTYQCYLKDVQRKVDEEIKIINKDLGAYFGAKIVRGAYMVQEKARAQKLQIPDPVCEDYSATCQNYNSIISQILDKSAESRSKFHVIVASHNEESIKLAVRRMNELNIDKNREICFGQLYGMCDQVTYPLANSGYAVYKSIPFGKIDEVLPYLARRAVENRSIIEGARKERLLLNKELKRRMGQKFSFQSSSRTEGSQV